MWPGLSSNDNYSVRCETVQEGMNTISLQLIQNSKGSNGRTNFRRVDDVEKRPSAEIRGRP